MAESKPVANSSSSSAKRAAKATTPEAVAKAAAISADTVSPDNNAANSAGNGSANGRKTNKDKFDFSRMNSLAVVSFATALTSIGALAAIITGHFALAQLKRTDEYGRGLAITGLVLGYLTIGLWIVGGVLMLLAKAYLAKEGYFDMMPGMWMWGEMDHMRFDRD